MAEALEYHGYVQIDPLNVCGRMHDLILRNRVHGYREGDLMRHIHQPDRPGFESYFPALGILAAFPRSAWRFLVPAMERRRTKPGGYAGRLSRAEENLARRILDEIGKRGPVTSDGIDHVGIAVTAWGTQARAVKIVLEKLFLHGRVLIAGRRNFRRVYDLPERVLPAEILAQEAATPVEMHRWGVLTCLRQRRLARLKQSELSLVADAVRPVQIDGGPLVYGLREDLASLETAASANEPANQTPADSRLLAPLDPLIYDRRLTSRLWEYEYTWEVYTPAAKRTRGYYALPILSGDRLVGHVDLRADRDLGRLQIVSRRVARGHRHIAAVRDLADFLGLPA